MASLPRAPQGGTLNVECIEKNRSSGAGRESLREIVGVEGQPAFDRHSPQMDLLDTPRPLFVASRNRATLLVHRRAVIDEFRSFLWSVRRTARAAPRVARWYALARVLMPPTLVPAPVACRCQAHPHGPLPPTDAPSIMQLVRSAQEWALHARTPRVSACRWFWKCYHFKK